MKKDFKRAGYLLTVLIFLLGIGALVVSAAAHYFSYSDSVVIIGEFVTFVALIVLVMMCIFAKSNYNYVCTRFADYIIESREKESQFQENEAQHLKQIETMRTSAQRERDTAVAAALEQGRREGAVSAPQTADSNEADAYAAPSQPVSIPSAAVSQPVAPSATPPVYSAAAPRTAAQRPVGGYVMPLTLGDEILYNEYGEPVMIRRRVRRVREAVGDMYYDRGGNSVARTAEPTDPSQPS